MLVQKAQGSETALRAVQLERTQLMESIRTNETEGVTLKLAIQANEEAKRELQKTINTATAATNNTAFLQMLSQFRIQAIQLQELQFQVRPATCLLANDHLNSSDSMRDLNLLRSL
jgi:hypothetical protein